MISRGRAHDTYAEAGPLGTFGDDARRISDAYNLHLVADPSGSPQKWLAFRLENGECDPTLYHSKPDAIRAKGLFAKLWGFALILETGMTPAQAASYLRTCRMVADNPNLRWMNTDADAPEAASGNVIMPMNREHLGRIPLL